MFKALSSWIGAVSSFLGLNSNAITKLPGARTGRGLQGKGAVGSKGVLASQGLGVDDWLESGYWAVVVSSNVTAVRYGEPDPTQVKDEKEKALLETYLHEHPLVSRAGNPKSPTRHATLYVAFATRNLGGTRIYKYFGVERHVAESMFLSDSLGRFVHERLKGGVKKGRGTGARATSRYPYAGPFTPSGL